MISLDEFVYYMEEDTVADSTGEVVWYKGEFDGTSVEVFIDPLNDWWTWKARRRKERFDHADCWKNSAGEAMFSAYYELLQAHWI